jgi:hypothetical protein
MSNQSMMPVDFTWGDGWGFSADDEYPQIVVRTALSRRFGFYGSMNAKYVLEPQVPYLFDVELIPEGGTRFEVKLTGKERGACWLSIYDEDSYNNSVGDVYVRVYPRRTLYVNVFVVQDASGLWPRTTLSAAAQRISEINKFLTPQTGITLRTHILDGFTIAQDASSSPIMSSHLEAAIWSELTDNARQFDASTTHLNLYLLRRWGARDVCLGGSCDKNVTGTANDIGGRHCIAEDENDPFVHANLIAHELMHSVGMTHNTDRGEWALMHPSSDYGREVFSEDVTEVRGEP